MLARITTLLGGYAATAAMTLARNLLVARLISPEDYGIAVSFAVAMAMVEMASQFGMQAQIVQARDGDDPRFLAGVHGFQIARAAISVVALYCAAGPLARFLGIPDLAWAYQVMAVAPALRALHHFDIHRQTRRMQFAPLLLTGFLPATASLCAVLPLALIFDDWRIMLFALLLHEALACLASHLLATRPYRVQLDLTLTQRSLRFGWPILAQGIVMFAAFQGDKILVARLLGFEALGVFAMGVTLSLAPVLILSRTVQSWFLPQLSTLSKQQAQTSMAAIEAGMLLSLIYMAGALSLAPALIAGALPAGFQSLAVLLPWMAVQQAMRVARSGAVTVALSHGVSWMGLLADAIRAASLPVAFLVLINGGSLLGVVLVAFVAEAMATSTVLLLCARRFELSVAVPSSLLGFGLVLLPTVSLHVGIGVGTATTLGMAIAFLAAAPSLRACLFSQGDVFAPQAAPARPQ